MNTDRSKQLIEQAVRSLPLGFKYQSVKQHMLIALEELNKLETKNEKKRSGVTPLNQWQLDLTTGTMLSPLQKQNALSELEALIKKEQAKLESKKGKPSQPPKNDQLFG